MWALIPSKERKIYQIVERLYFAQNALTLRELSDLVGSARRTVSDYIDELKARVDKIGGTLKVLPEGYVLVLPDNVSIITFQHATLKASPYLQLLEKLLIKNEMTGLKIESALHISASTLSRMITVIKNELADYGLNLETNPYRVSGDEFLVRRFFTSYFLEAYGHEEWPLPFVDYSEIEKLIDSLAQIDSIHFETVNVKKFILFTAVSVVRESYRHHLSEPEAIRGRHEAGTFEHVHRKVKVWLDGVDISSDKKELYGRIYTSYMFYYFRSYTSTKVLLERPDHSNTIENGLVNIAKSFGLPLSDFSHIANKIDDTLYQYSKTSYAKALDTYLFFTPADYPVIDVYSQQYRNVYKPLKELLYNTYSLYDIDPDQINTDELLYLIITRWDKLSLYLYENYTRCDILVYSPNSYRHADNVAQFFRVKLERACRISVYTEPIMNEQRLSRYSFDILISVGSLDLDIEQPILAFHSRMTGKHLKPLLKAIDKVYKKNRDKLIHEQGL